MFPRSSFNTPRKQQRGFTLIEVLVAISLLAIVLTAVFGIFTSVNTNRIRLNRDSERYHLARVVFDRIGRELHGAYFRSNNLSTFFRGGTNQRHEPYLELTTMAVTPLSATGTGIAEVRYRLAADPESQSGGMVLVRGEHPRQSASRQVEDRMMRLAPDVAGFSIRFYTNGRWQTDWDAAASGLPQLVEVSLLIGQEEQDQLPFTTTFELPDFVSQ